MHSSRAVECVPTAHWPDSRIGGGGGGVGWRVLPFSEKRETPCEKWRPLDHPLGRTHPLGHTTPPHRGYPPPPPVD